MIQCENNDNPFGRVRNILKHGRFYFCVYLIFDKIFILHKVKKILFEFR